MIKARLKTSASMPYLTGMISSPRLFGQNTKQLQKRLGLSILSLVKASTSTYIGKVVSIQYEYFSIYRKKYFEFPLCYMQALSFSETGVEISRMQMG